MINKDEFIEQLNVVQSKKEITDYIKNNVQAILWEIDMNVLRASTFAQNWPALDKIEIHRLSDIFSGTPPYLPLFSPPLFHDGASDGKKIMELVESMRKGIKIIPALFIRTIKNSDGVKQSSEKLSFWSGMHCLRIALAMRLYDVPIIISNKYEHYFSFQNNNIQVIDNGIKVTSKSNSYTHNYSFDDNNYKITDDGVSILPILL